MPRVWRGGGVGVVLLEPPDERDGGKGHGRREPRPPDGVGDEISKRRDRTLLLLARRLGGLPGVLVGRREEGGDVGGACIGHVCTELRVSLPVWLRARKEGGC